MEFMKKFQIGSELQNFHSRTLQVHIALATIFSSFSR